MSIDFLRRGALKGAHFGVGAIAMLALAGSARTVRAQVAEGDGFLIGQPNGSFTLRGGWASASAGGDLFSFTTSKLTLSRGDFSSPTVGADLAFRLRPRTDIVFSATLAGVSRKSEFRNYIDNNNLPIEQRTMFDRVPLTVSLKHYLTDRGRSIGKLAWIPSRVAPYIGVGGGAEWYRFRQEGDFVDFQTLDVFPAQLESSGWAATANAFVGADFSLDPRFALVTEARYGWSRAGLSQDFTGFSRIDLSGFSTTAGIAVRF